MKSMVVSVPRSDYIYERKHRYSFRQSVTYFFRRYGLITFFIIVLFSGMIFGAVRAGRADKEFMDKLDILFSTNIAVKQEQTLAQTFINSFCTSFLFLVLLFCFSLSPLGLVLIPPVMFFRGFGYGISSGFLCITYGIKGFIYYILVMLLGAFVSSLALVYASQYCFDFSKEMLLSIFCGKPSEAHNLRRKIGELSLSCGYMIIIIIFASLLDTVLYYLIGGLFVF